MTYPIPGSNLLATAFRMITPQIVLYYRSNGRSLNSIGQDVTQYAPPINMIGSFQPVPQRLYENLGLDFKKSYIYFITENALVDTKRDVSADQIFFNDILYQCQSSTKWFNMDRWNAVLCVEIADKPMHAPLFGFNEIVGAWPTLLNSYSNFCYGNFANGVKPNDGQ